MQATGASKTDTSTIETGDRIATVTLMRVKEELAPVKLGGEDNEEKLRDEILRNVKGGRCRRELQK